MNTKLSNDMIKMLKDTVKKQLAIAKASYNICIKLQAHTHKLDKESYSNELTCNSLEKQKLIKTKYQLYELIITSIVESCDQYLKVLHFASGFNNLADDPDEMYDYIKEINKHTKLLIAKQQITTDTFTMYVSIILKI